MTTVHAIIAVSGWVACAAVWLWWQRVFELHRRAIARQRARHQREMRETIERMLIASQGALVRVDERQGLVDVEVSRG